MNSKCIRASAAWALAILACVALSGCGESRAGGPAPNLEVAKNLRESKGAAAGDSGQSAVAATTGWATLKGQFVLNGDPPGLNPIATAGKDAMVGGTVVCGDRIPDQTFSFDPATKGIANVVLYVRKAPRVHESAAELAGQDALFDQKGCIFLTHVLAVQIKQPVHFKNSDPVVHNTNIAPPLDKPSNLSIQPNGEMVYAFSKEQLVPVPVTCNVHPWMKGYVIPRKNPYVAVTAADGTFSIPNLPAGEDLEFQVWHERAGGSGGGFAVARPDLKWTGQGRFKVKLAADEELDLGQIQVPGSAF